jgi:hypothetical protein
MKAFDRALIKAFFALAFVLFMLAMAVATHAQTLKPTLDAVRATLQDKAYIVDSTLERDLTKRFTAEHLWLFGIAGTFEAIVLPDGEVNTYTWTHRSYESRELGVEVYQAITREHGKPSATYSQLHDGIAYDWDTDRGSISLSVDAAEIRVNYLRDDRAATTLLPALKRLEEKLRSENGSK